MEEKKLKSCPFCGSANLIINIEGEEVILSKIHCADCSAYGPEVYSPCYATALRLARTVWNARK